MYSEIETKDKYFLYSLHKIKYLTKADEGIFVVKIVKTFIFYITYFLTPVTLNGT